MRAVVPRSAKQVPPAAERAGDPLLHVTGHVVGSVGSHAAITANRGGSSSVKVAQRENVRIAALGARRSKPLVRRWKALADEAGVRRGFVPGHAGNWKIRRAFGERAILPILR